MIERRYKLNKLLIEILDKSTNKEELSTNYAEYRKLKNETLADYIKFNQWEELSRFKKLCISFESKAINKFMDREELRDNVQSIMGDYIYDCRNLPAYISKIEDQDAKQDMCQDLEEIFTNELEMLKVLHFKGYSKGYYVIDITDELKRLDRMIVVVQGGIECVN